MNLVTDIYVSLKTEDISLLDMNKRIEKLTLMDVWLAKAASLFERYYRVLEENNKETDKVKMGLKIEEMDICFMASVSYFLRCFLNQKGSLNLEINHVTTDSSLRDTYKKLMDLRNDEYVHWKGARSTILVKYSFAAITVTTCEFAKTIQANYSETIGPVQQPEQIRALFRVTQKYIDDRRSKELAAMRRQLLKKEVWLTTNFYNDNGEPVIKKS